MQTPERLKACFSAWPAATLRTRAGVMITQYRKGAQAGDSLPRAKPSGVEFQLDANLSPVDVGLEAKNRAVNFM